MKVKRIVMNLYAPDVALAASFYRDLFELDVLMDHGWLVTLGCAERMTVQMSLASEGGSGTLVPDLSIEVDDLDAILARVRDAGLPIEYGPADEPWGVRRFYLRDPFGRLVNVLVHT